jgi:hypothetical protein
MFGGVVELMADYQDLRGESFAFPRLEHKHPEAAVKSVEVEADGSRFYWKVHIASVKSREGGRRLAREVAESAINRIVFREELRFGPVEVVMDGLEHLGSMPGSCVLECAPATVCIDGMAYLSYLRSPELIREEVLRYMEEESSWRDDFYSFFRSAIRNELAHRRKDSDILDVKRRMAEIVPDLRGIVRQAISKQSSQPEA